MHMPSPKILKVAALVDLPRTPEAGGHIKCWERLASAAAYSSLPLDLTVYFSGATKTEIVGPKARFRHLPPVFSTARLKFLPYVPDHTDLAPYHPRLARELGQFDVIHTTDAYFAFSRTATRVSRARNIPLVTSMHTDTPSYTRIFARQTLEKMFGSTPALRRQLIEKWDLPERKGRGMERKLEQHLTKCRYALVTRKEDHMLAEGLLGADRVQHLRLGVDKNLFNPERADRAGIERDYNIPAGRIVLLFVGRVDIGKNIHTLINAMAKLIAQGIPLHLITAGKGPATEDVRRVLGNHTSIPGYVLPDELGRLYASVDGLALASEVEIRSMAGVEAMASGCPALVSSRSGVAELFNNTSAMQTIDSGVDSWAEAIAHFASNPEKRAAMRRDASTYCRDYLSSWIEILTQDVFAAWRDAARQSKLKVA